ncbi:MAG: peptidoglycan D,D-transpeptidase FtsI family protein, partial [Olsenella sp.]
MTRRGFIALFGVVAARLFYLQIVDGADLASAAESNRTNVATLHAKRGTIYDRNGNVLAMSINCS